MTWGSWEVFFTMGGYGLYVWGSYGVTLAIMAAEVAWLRHKKRLALENIRRLSGLRDGGAQ